MMISWSRWVTHDDFHAAVWCVVLSFTFFPITVPNVVSILFVKLVEQKMEIKKCCSLQIMFVFYPCNIIIFKQINW